MCPLPHVVSIVALALGAIMMTSPAVAADVGETAPSFTLKDLAGRDRSLSEFKGRTVVLEWSNPNCPFVQKHYDSGNMQSLQRDFGARQVVWLTVNSTARGAADYLDPVALTRWEADRRAVPASYLVDPSGDVGRAYGAKTTPHMYVIDPSGKLVYAGGIDDKRSTSVADVKSAKNFVRTALEETLSGKAVSTPTTTPYGCSVKYVS